MTETRQAGNQTHGAKRYFLGSVDLFDFDSGEIPRAASGDTATTVLALIPILTSTGRGSDIMVPMAIPSFGGMTFEIVTMLVVPILFCTISEFKKHTKLSNGAVSLISLLSGFMIPVFYCSIHDRIVKVRLRKQKV